MPERGREFLRWTFIGAVLGLVILGIGGRIAMRGIAIANGTPGGFTLGGTMTVVSLGGVSGAAGGALHVLSRWFVPGHQFARLFLYVTVMLLITWRGVNPATTQNVTWFFPLVVGFIIALEWLWVRHRSRGALPPAVS